MHNGTTRKNIIFLFYDWLLINSLGDNLNQLGEAAGVAAYHAINSRLSLSEVEAISVANTMKAGGSAL